MNLVQAQAIAGKLGKPSKMPGMSYGLPISACKVGTKLRKIAGSACSKCYAGRGHYRYKNVLNAQDYRLASLTHPEWVAAIVVQIIAADCLHFRWHDSGDINSFDHLKKIVEAAERLPDVKFWVPTRENAVVRKYLKEVGNFPKNLIVRVSSPMINDKPLLNYAHTSTIHDKGKEAGLGHTCPSKLQDNTCGQCRACWDPKIPNVSYERH